MNDRSAAGTDPDAVLLVSFGGPRGPDDVIPFLENVTAGRGIPKARLEVVGEHYFARGGVSPINDETEALAQAMRVALAERGAELPVYVGNRNWTPTIDEAFERAASEGRRHLAVVVTSAYSGYSSCRQYREDVAASLRRATETRARGGRVGTVGGASLPHLSYVRPWGLADPVVDTWAARTRAVLSSALADAGAPDRARIVFVAHSIPDRAAVSSGPPDRRGAYVRQLTEVAARSAADANRALGAEVAWELVYCSRSGSPEVPWLEPDVNDALVSLAGEGVRSVAMVPIGFVADHMEVVWDLDTEAAATAAECGITVHRAPTLRNEPAVAALLVNLALAAGRNPGFCPRGCCAAPQRPGSSTRPAAFEEDAAAR